MENHYCAECQRTTRFLPTDRFVSLGQQKFRIYMCVVCSHDIWVQVRGIIIVKEAQG